MAKGIVINYGLTNGKANNLVINNANQFNWGVMVSDKLFIVAANCEKPVF